LPDLQSPRGKLPGKTAGLQTLPDELLELPGLPDLW
jgi:hypothetical protein